MKTTPRIHALSALLLALLLALLPASAAAVHQAAQAQSGAGMAPATAGPEHVQVQHILIGFNGSVPGKMITRTRADSKKLAYDVLKRARKGADFDSLVKKYTDDQAPGIYGMSNIGVTPAQGEYPRAGMVQSFGDVGFHLKPGKIGIADYDSAKSKFGWHIIKRLK